MKIVFRFVFGNKDYCVYLENNKTKYGYIVDDKIYDNLSDTEINLIDTIIASIMPNSDLLYFHDTIVNNNKYSIYIDKKTGLKTFMPNPKEEDLVYLNKLYNNLYNPVMHDKRLPMPDNDKSYKYACVLLSISVALYVNLSIDLIKFCNENRDLVSRRSTYNSYVYTANYGIDKNSTDEEIISKIKEIIDKNPNLTDSEKRELLSNPRAILDNKEYINFDTFLTKLSLLNIEYVEDAPMEDEIWAAYTSDTLIVIGYSNDYESASESVFTHEMSHLYSSYERKLRSSILEPLNCMFNTKYFNEDCGYYYCINNFKILARIIGPEKLKVCQFTGGDDVVIHELNEIIPDNDKAYKLLDYMEEYKALCEDQTRLFKKGGFSDEIMELSARISGVQTEINKLFSEYYYKKFNTNIEDDIFLNNDKKYKYGMSGNIYTEDELRLRNYVIAKYDVPLMNSPRCEYGYELNLQNDINVFDENSRMIYVQKIIYVFDGYDEDNNVLYKKVLGEKEYLCSFDDIDKNDYKDYNPWYMVDYLGCTLESEFESDHFRAVQKILPRDIVCNWDSNETDIIVTDEDVVDYLMTLIPDRDKAYSFVNAKVNKFTSKSFEELCCEYYNAKYGSNMYDDAYMLCVFKPKEVENKIRDMYNLSSYDEVYIDFKYDNDEPSLTLSIIDNTNYHEYETEYGEKVMGIGIDNISKIKVSDLNLNLGRNL